MGLGMHSWHNPDYQPPRHDEAHDRILAERRKRRARRWVWPAGIVAAAAGALLVAHALLHLL